MTVEFYFVIGAIAAVVAAFFWLRGAAKEHSDRPWRDDVEQQQNWPE